MKINKKIIFYEVNPKFFKDQNRDGIGDLKGIISNFEYFNHLGVDAIILQDVIATNSTSDKVSYVEIDPVIGDINDLIKVISLAKKYNKKIILEINIGTIKKNNNWFFASNENNESKFYKVIDFKSHKENKSIEYEYSEDNKNYFIYNSKTGEIPLNWKINSVLNNFLRVIEFWKKIGISGFVLEKFEYLVDEAKVEILNKNTIMEMKKLYSLIKKIDHKLIVIGKSNLVKISDVKQYTSNKNKIFDYFMSTKISLTGTSYKYGLNALGFFTPKMYSIFLKDYVNNSSNILSFNSKEVGKAISRWTNDGEYIQESAKALAILLMINNASPSIYYGDEIGLPNIGLTSNDDFQTPNFEENKLIAFHQKISEKEFYQAQSENNPINARALMIWNDGKNGGFSFADKTITPVSWVVKNINVKSQYNTKKSILNFYRELIKLVSYSSLSELITEGKIKSSTFILGIIKYTIFSEKKLLDVIINLTDSNRINIFAKQGGKVLLSTYGNKTYHKIPKVFAPYEGIIVLKYNPKYIRKIQQDKIEKLKKLKYAEYERINVKNQKKREVLEKQKINDKVIKKEEKQTRIAEKSQAKEDKKQAKIVEKSQSLTLKQQQVEKFQVEKAKKSQAKEEEKQTRIAEKSQAKEDKKQAKIVEKSQSLTLKQQQVEKFQIEKAKKSQAKEEEKQTRIAEKSQVKEDKKQAKIVEKSQSLTLKQQQVEKFQIEKAKKSQVKEDKKQTRIAEKSQVKEDKKQAKIVEKSQSLTLKQQQVEKFQIEKAKKSQVKEDKKQAKIVEKSQSLTLKQQQVEKFQIEKAKKSQVKEDKKQTRIAEKSQVKEDKKQAKIVEKSQSLTLKQQQVEKFQIEKAKKSQVKEDKKQAKIVEKSQSLTLKQQQVEKFQIKEQKKSMEALEKLQAKEQKKQTKAIKKVQTLETQIHETSKSQKQLEKIDTKYDSNESVNDKEVELKKFKQSIKIDHDVDYSHLDETTKLKEEEVAKTTLIDDTIDLDELFDLDENKK